MRRSRLFSYPFKGEAVEARIKSFNEQTKPVLAAYSQTIDVVSEVCNIFCHHFLPVYSVISASIPPSGARRSAGRKCPPWHVLRHWHLLCRNLSHHNTSLCCLKPRLSLAGQHWIKILGCSFVVLSSTHYVAQIYQCQANGVRHIFICQTLSPTVTVACMQRERFLTVSGLSL